MKNNFTNSTLWTFTEGHHRRRDHCLANGFLPLWFKPLLIPFSRHLHFHKKKAPDHMKFRHKKRNNKLKCIFHSMYVITRGKHTPVFHLSLFQRDKFSFPQHVVFIRSHNVGHEGPQVLTSQGSF